MPAFVGWHLVFLLFRNPISVQEQAFEDWLARRHAVVRAPIDALNRMFVAYEHALALDQGWRMFVAPLARDAPFPAVLIAFDDGTSEIVRSDNEPSDPNGFVLRRAQPRLRKHETQVASTELAELGLGAYWSRYLEWQCRRWRRAHPSDGRRVVELSLLRREYALPAPGAREPGVGAPETFLIGSMPAEGCDR